MGMQTPQDLFLHELGDMYDAEQRILQMLPTMAKECDNDQVRQAFQHHEQETKQQVQNLDKCFQALGAKPPQTTCAAIAGESSGLRTIARASATVASGSRITGSDVMRPPAV